MRKIIVPGTWYEIENGAQNAEKKVQGCASEPIHPSCRGNFNRGRKRRVGTMFLPLGRCLADDLAMFWRCLCERVYTIMSVVAASTSPSPSPTWPESGAGSDSGAAGASAKERPGRELTASNPCGKCRCCTACLYTAAILFCSRRTTVHPFRTVYIRST